MGKVRTSKGRKAITEEGRKVRRITKGRKAMTTKGKNVRTIKRRKGQQWGER